MNDYGWQAKIQDRWDLAINGYAVYLTQKFNGGRQYLLRSGEVVSVKQGEQLKEEPLFAVLDEEQMMALAEALSKSGVKTRPVHQLEGMLEATNKHLEDMRSLVFQTGTRRKSSSLQ